MAGCRDPQLSLVSRRPAEQKEFLRARFSSLRRADAESPGATTHAISRRLATLLAMLMPSVLVGYEPMRGEIDIRPVLNAYAGVGVPIFLPSWRSGARDFVDSQSGARLDRFVERVTILVPGVAFDKQGVRLGRGAGWYDQVLSLYPAARCIGCGYDSQLVESLPRDEWDVAMNYVVTSKRSIVVDPTVNPTGECPNVWT